jgi:hypothetical protein
VLPSHAERHRLLELSMVVNYAAAREAGTPMDGTASFSLCGEYHVDDEELRRHARALVPGYRGAATVEDVATLSAAELLAQALENAMTRPYGIAAGRPLRLVLGEVARESESTARGFVHESPSVVGGGETWMLELRREGGRWYVLPGVELLSRGSGIAVIFRWIVAEAAGREQNRASGF